MVLTFEIIVVVRLLKTYYVTIKHLSRIFTQLHVERVLHTYAKPDMVTHIGKLFHRFDGPQVKKLLDEAEQAQ